MSTSAEPVPAPHHTTFAEAEAKRHWIDQAARTTAVLAVLAAVSSGQYANQFSHTILAQAEASDQWSYYQAKSIKRHLVNAQIETLTALARTSPQAAADLEKLQAGDQAAVKKYDAEMAEAKAKAEKIEAEKRLHQKQGNWFQGAFIVLQAGGGACTTASNSQRKETLAAALALPGLPLGVVGYGPPLCLHPPP